MNEELKRLLDNARAAGANASQLQGIVDAYNLKKKDNPNGTGNAIIGGEIGGIAGASKAQSVEPKVNAINNDEELSISSFKRRGQIPNAVKEAGGNAIVKNPEILFSGADKEGLKNLREKYNVTEFGFNPIEDIRKSEAFKSLDALTSSGDKLANITSSNDVSYRPYIAELTDAKSVEENLIARLGEKKNQLRKNLFKDDAKTINKTKDEISVLENDLRLAKKIRNKAAAELAIEGEDEIEATIRTDESGNLLNKTTNRLMAITTNPAVSNSGLIGMSLENSDRIDKLPPQFVTGLNYLKNSEPVIFERVTDALQKGLPISESQIATITQQGIELEQSRLKRKLDKEEITPEDYSAKAVELNTVRKNNLLDNNETLRAFLSDGAANILDEIGKAKNAAADIANPTSSYAFGHTWNYDDKEIKYAAEQYAAKNGLDPQDGRIQKAIKYLQDNEGAMIMENSIAKAGGVRELFKGLAEPIRGISNSIEDLGKSSNDVYAESQSQGNVNISEKRLKLEDTGIRGVVNDIVKGTGQFVTQAGLAYLTSGAVGLTGKALLGAADAAAIESGVALTNATKSDIIGKALLGTKDGISTFITSYAQAYDSNLKNALSYTSDNQLAKQAASVNSALEGATELFLSPLDIAKGIGAKFASKGVTEDLLKVLSDKDLMKSPDKLKDFLSKTLKAVSGTTYVAGAEIGEEYVTQIADYVTNATLNPNSQTFQNRDLQNELSVTAYQTGLSMAIPALLNGIGAANANSFSKGSLLVAAQNRQKLIEGLDEDLALNNIDQDEYNEKAQIINTAAVANAELPLKADGTKLSTDEKADYIFSRTSEAIMKDKIEKSKDEAEKRILEGKIKTQQDFRTELLGTPTVVQQVVSDELAADAVITETQQNSTPETEIDIIPALKEKLTNVTIENDAELLNYAIDKVAEAPTKLKTDLGDELFNQVLAQTPTEKLQEGLDFLINNNPDSEDVKVLDDLISERESQSKVEKPISEDVLKGEPENISQPIELSVEPSNVKVEKGIVGVLGDVLLKDIDKKDENYDSIEDAVKGKNFVRQTVSIDELVAKDKDLQEYLNDNKETKGRKIEKAIIVGNIARGGEAQNGGVIDGFHRIAQAIANGETKINAYVEQSLKETPKAETQKVEEKIFTKNALDRADAKKIYQQVREVDVATDAAQVALEYIANGGKISEGIINEVAGSVKRASLNTGAKEKRSSEYNVRDYADKGNETLDGLAHRLWENNNQRIPETEIKDALMDVVNSHNTRLDAAKSYLERYSAEYNEKQMQEKFYQEHLKEIEAEEKAINDFLNNEKELENEAFADENYVTNLIEKYEQETKGENKQSTSKTESGTNQGISSNASNEKTKVENEKEPIQKTDEGIAGRNEPITPKESSTTKEGNGENLQGEGGGKGKFEEKARKLAEKIMATNIVPDWLKIDDPNINTNGVSAEQIKKALADATITMGKLLDKGVEFNKAVKEAVNEIVYLLGENNRQRIEEGFTKDYKNDFEEPIQDKNIATSVNSKLTDIELGVIRNVLESTIDARQYPTFFDMNQPLVQQTAKTQGEGQDRIPLDGSYIQAHLADLRSISLNNARVLRDALGNDWKEKMINFFEENPKAGDIAVVSGILNVINTDINNEIAASKNGTEISKLKDLQARADRITYDTARSASLALNQRRLYQDFGQGKNVADIISSIILTPEQQDIKRKVEEALKQKFTDEELNKPKPPKPKKPKAAPKPKASNSKNDDSVKNYLISKGQKAAQQTDADGNVTIVSLKDKIQQANDALNGFKC